jgi:hypothetical protein
MKHKIGFLEVLCAGLAFWFLTGGCATVGRDFPAARVPEISLGQTTQRQVRDLFGPPWRVGIEDGGRVWTYGKYRYRLFSPASTQDLVIRFNDQGVVSSYTYNTTDHNE